MDRIPGWPDIRPGQKFGQILKCGQAGYWTWYPAGYRILSRPFLVIINFQILSYFNNEKNHKKNINIFIYLFFWCITEHEGYVYIHHYLSNYEYRQSTRVLWQIIFMEEKLKQNSNNFVNTGIYIQIYPDFSSRIILILK